MASATLTKPAIAKAETREGQHARSINLANAVSIAAYECYRQLRP